MTDNRTTETALNRVHFNEYGDYLDKPYVVRALKSFDVNKLDVHRPPGKPGGLGFGLVPWFDLESSLGGMTMS